jgi:hypothetical protein
MCHKHRVSSIFPLSLMIGFLRPVVGSWPCFFSVASCPLVFCDINEIIGNGKVTPTLEVLLGARGLAV